MQHLARGGGVLFRCWFSNVVAVRERPVRGVRKKKRKLNLPDWMESRTQSSAVGPAGGNDLDALLLDTSPEEAHGYWAVFFLGGGVREGS